MVTDQRRHSVVEERFNDGKLHTSFHPFQNINFIINEGHHSVQETCVPFQLVQSHHYVIAIINYKKHKLLDEMGYLDFVCFKFSAEHCKFVEHLEAGDCAM